MEDLSFEEIVQGLDFNVAVKVESYLCDNFGMKANRSLRLKKKNIVEFVDSIDDEAYDRLNAYVDGLLERGNL